MLKPRLLHAVLREEHAEMGNREIDVELPQRGHQLGGQPSRRQKIELPADLATTPGEALDSRQELRRESRFEGLHRRHVDAHAAHAE